MLSRPFPILTGALFLFFAIPQAVPQTGSGLTGTVTDNSGAIVAAGAVEAVNSTTGVVYRTQSTGSGTYVLQFLPPGVYTLSCELAGFKRFSESGLALETGFVRTVDIRLEVGQVSETVAVTASTPLLESESSSLGQLVERSTLANLPMQSRRGAGLVQLAGGVLYQGEVVGGESVPLFTLAGGLPRNQQWLLDGTTVQNSAIGLPQMAINPPMESLQDFKVESNGFSAEIGRAGGGAIIMTTRSGTNDFHAAAYEFLRNDAMDARSFFAKTKAPLRYNVFGGSVGGPIIKGKTFFFFNYEGGRRNEGVTYSSDIVPNPAELSGDFSRRRDVTVLDPQTRQPFAGNVIPAGRLDPIAQKLAKFFPAPNVAVDPTRAPGADYINNAVNITDTDYYMVRIDHSLRDKDRIFGRVVYWSAATSMGAVYTFPFLDPRATTGPASSPTYALNWIHNIRPTIFNEMRFERLNSKGTSNTGGSPANQSNINKQIGLNGVDPTFAPILQITGYTQFGLSTQVRKLPKRLTQEFVDTVSWARGKHNIKTGIDFRYSSFQDQTLTSPGGNFSFTNRATGDGLATFLLGWTTSGALNANDLLSTRTDYWGAFVQDDWKITPKLTLNLGLRWEMDTPRWELNNEQNSFSLAATNPVSGTPGVVTFAGLNGQSKYAHDFDPNNVAPHAGFAWRASDQIVVRAGYGMFFLGEYGTAVPNSMAASFSRQASFTSGDGGFTPPFLFNSGLPAIPPVDRSPAFGAVPIGAAPFFSPQFITSNHKTGYTQHWNASIQRQFHNQILIEASYLANVGHRLPGQNINLDVIPLVNSRGPATQDQKLRPYPQFSGLTTLNPDLANSTYHAMNLRAEKRYSNGLNFLVNFTWSKYIDGGLDGVQHIQLIHLDKSLSLNDVPRRLNGEIIYELPFGRGRRFASHNGVLNQIAGGWSLSFIPDLHDGTPFGVVEQTDLSNTFSGTQRPNLIGNPKLSASRSRGEYIAQYFNSAAFVSPGAGAFGNAARTVLRGPGSFSLDSSLGKAWAFTEKYRLKFRADFFNLPNQPNFGLPNGSQGNAQFGKLTSAALGRQGQMSLRFEF